MNIKQYAISTCKALAFACTLLTSQLAQANTLVVPEPLSADYTRYYIIGGALAALLILFVGIKLFKKKEEPMPPMPPVPPIPPAPEPPSAVFTGTTPNGLAVEFSVYMADLVKVKGLGIGREVDNSIQIADPSVSRYHAEVRARDGFIWLGDLGSSNGTYINGNKLNTKQFAKLHTGDAVKIGKVEGKISVQ